MPALRTTLAATPAAARQARHLVRSLFPRASDTFVAELLTAELVTNAVVHAGGELVLHADYDGARLHVEVEDDSAAPPVLSSTDPGDDAPRGMLLVDDLATAWGTEPRGLGKVVWFEIDLRDAE